MAGRRQVVVCPVCGASRKLSDLNLDGNGNFITDPEERKTYILAMKLLEFGGTQCDWSTHDIPLHVLAGVAAQLRSVLERVDAALAEQGVSD